VKKQKLLDPLHDAETPGIKMAKPHKFQVTFEYAGGLDPKKDAAIKQLASKFDGKVIGSGCMVTGPGRRDIQVALPTEKHFGLLLVSVAGRTVSGRHPGWPFGAHRVKYAEFTMELT
jgi:hypothetical protein